MSERGSFVTEYIYCDDCLNAASEVLLGKGKYLCSARIPHWNEPIEGNYLPIIAGKIGGSYPGEELHTFTHELIPKLEEQLCPGHAVRIAVLAERGDGFFVARGRRQEPILEEKQHEKRLRASVIPVDLQDDLLSSDGATAHTTTCVRGEQQ